MVENEKIYSQTHSHTLEYYDKQLHMLLSKKSNKQTNKQNTKIKEENTHNTTKLLSAKYCMGFCVLVVVVVIGWSFLI